MRYSRAWAAFLAIGLMSAAASAGDNPRPTPRAAAYNNDDLEKRRPSPTPPEMDPDGRSTATAPPTPIPRPTPTEKPYLPPPSLDLEQRKLLQDQLEAAEVRVASARKKVADLEAKLAAAASLSRPLAIYGTTNPEVPAIEAELQAAKQTLSEEESALSDIQERVDRAPR